MPYADGRTYYDADSHLMELGDWLVRYADPDIRDRIRPLYLGAAGALAERAVREAAARRDDPTARHHVFPGDVREVIRVQVQPHNRGAAKCPSGFLEHRDTGVVAGHANLHEY